MTKIDSKYKELVKRLDAFNDGKRCGGEFLKLCQKRPNLAKCEANFVVLLNYFLPDSLLFDHLSGIEAIENDEKLRQSLAWLDNAQVQEKAQEAIEEQNERQMARSVSDLHAELQQKDRESRERSQWKPPVPDDLTRKKFHDASRKEATEWVRKYGYERLNEKWAKEDFINA